MFRQSERGRSSTTAMDGRTGYPVRRFSLCGNFSGGLALVSPLAYRAWGGSDEAGLFEKSVEMVAVPDRGGA